MKRKCGCNDEDGIPLWIEDFQGQAYTAHHRRFRDGHVVDPEFNWNRVWVVKLGVLELKLLQANTNEPLLFSVLQILHVAFDGHLFA
jgi:hypothetical protein